MKIHISETSKLLLDKLGGFRCDYRGVFGIEVRISFCINVNVYSNYHIDVILYNIDSYFSICRISSLKWRRSGL